MDDLDKFPSQLAERFQVRLPDGMRDRLKAAAEANKRSMNAEIVARLDASFAASGEEALPLAIAERVSINVSALIDKLRDRYERMCDAVEARADHLDRENLAMQAEIKRLTRFDAERGDPGPVIRREDERQAKMGTRHKVEVINVHVEGENPPLSRRRGSSNSD